MRYLTAIAFMFIFTLNTQSQTFEMGPFVGGANYIGDVGRGNYIFPNRLVGGLIAKWNRSPRHAFRLSLKYAEIADDDANSSETRRVRRGHSFENNIAEASLGVEFNFWDFDLHEGHPQSTPYLYTGLTYFRADHVYLKNGTSNPMVNEGSNYSFAIPIIFGYKESITKHIVGGFEIGARYTFTDNLDGSWPEEFLGTRDPTIEFGNRNTNDWYIFTGVNFTFSWGRKPCYSRF
ncbi:type IX secretion system protein PorG [Salegentibacter sp. HM20]